MFDLVRIVLVWIVICTIDSLILHRSLVACRFSEVNFMIDLICV
jgi:hypothetical protein